MHEGEVGVNEALVHQLLCAQMPALRVDDAMLARSRGAAIHQACTALPYYLNTYPLIVERSRHKLTSLGVSRYTDS